MLDITALLEKVAVPPPQPSDDLARLWIAGIDGLSTAQIRKALHLIVQESHHVVPSDGSARIARSKVPPRYLAYGALLSRAKRHGLYKYWGYAGSYAFLREELQIPHPPHSYQIMVTYQRIKKLGFTPEEMEDLEQRRTYARVQKCAKYAANKNHCILALDSPHNMMRILYGERDDQKRTSFTLGPFFPSRKRYLVTLQVLKWFRREFNMTDGDALPAMALIIQAWLEKPPLERQRFLCTQLKELDLNPEIAERFF